MFRCTSIILRESLIMYTEVTKTYKINFAFPAPAVFAIKWQRLFPNNGGLLTYWI